MKRTPLKRKTPLRRSGRKLRPVSIKRAKQNKEYSVLRMEYLNKNPFCSICEKPACDIHHKKGRFGERLNNSEFFMAVCRGCHEWIHANPQISYAKDYLIKR